MCRESRAKLANVVSRDHLWNVPDEIGVRYGDFKIQTKKEMNAFSLNKIWLFDV